MYTDFEPVYASAPVWPDVNTIQAIGDWGYLVSSLCFAWVTWRWFDYPAIDFEAHDAAVAAVANGEVGAHMRPLSVFYRGNALKYPPYVRIKTTRFSQRIR